MEDSINSNRSLYVDNLAGVLILYVIIMHITNLTQCGNDILYLSVSRWIPFYMPWFFYKSGMFFRDYDYKNTLKNTYKKLIVPFLAFNVISIIVGFGVVLGKIIKYSKGAAIIEVAKCQILEYFNGLLSDFIWCGFVSLDGPLWFLLTLIICKLLFVLLCKLKVPKILIGILFGGIACLFYYYGDIRFPMWFKTVSSGMFFFTMGYILRNKQFNTYIMGLIILLYMIFLGQFDVDMASNSALSFVRYILWYPYCIVGIILINQIFKVFISKKIWIVTYVGRNSMSFFLSHTIVLVIFKDILSFLGVSHYGLFAFLYFIIISIIMLPIIDKILNTKFLKFIIGK